MPITPNTGSLFHAETHVLVMATLFGMFPFLKTLFADNGYQGPKFAKALAKVLLHLDVEIVKRSDQVSGFVVLPKRWIVERTVLPDPHLNTDSKDVVRLGTALRH